MTTSKVLRQVLHCVQVLATLALLLGFSVHAAASMSDTSIVDSVVNGGVIASPTGGASATSAGAANLARSLGKLAEVLTTIFGVYYALKSVLIYSRVVSGRGAGQQDSMGSVLSHFVAGIFAYHSRAFFIMVHNTIPMIPDFGKLMYDAELMLGLMQ
jgi:hypothetical protein